MASSQSNLSLARAQQPHRLPRFLPGWIEERVNVHVYKLYRFVDRVSRELPGNARLLDAGAGEGRFKASFAHQQYIGVDLAIGSPDWDFSGLDTVADLAHLPFANGTFDAVLCCQTLEHVPEPARVVTELARMLRPGGKLYLSAPQSWHQHQKPHDYFRYTSFGLRHLVERAGLQVETVEPLGGYFWFLSFQLQNLIHWGIGRPASGWKRICIWPLKALLGSVFQVALPLLLFYLDPLDRLQDETFGHVCVAVKAE
jgi:SAM-dependent methyltransferase